MPDGFTNIIPKNTAKTAEVRKMMDEIRGWFGDFEVKLTQAHREAVQIFFNTVVETTPRKTGYASWMWRMSPVGAFDPTMPQRKEELNFYHGTVEQPDYSSIRWNSNTIVYNFTPYIEMINNGYSTQYPYFFEHAEAIAENHLQGLLRAI